jgi:tRNA threonylcarbamoyladenosine biosynthesis protein TsaB
VKNAILGIETATGVCSAAIVQGTQVWERSVEGGRRHDAELMLMIDEVLKGAALGRADLAAVAVSAGPGSYTGLRIGVSVAKALSEALLIPLISVPSLVAAGLHGIRTADTARGTDNLFLAAFPSRRKEVFAAAFRITSDGAEQVGDTLAGDAEPVLEALRSDGLTVREAVGPGAAAFENALPFDVTQCSAATVATLGQTRFNRQTFVDAELFEPYYLKEFVAGVPTKSVFARLSF